MPSRLRPSRRLTGLLYWLWLVTVPAAAEGGLVTLDWTLAETLVALDAPPRAVAQVDDYHTWVQAPPLPDTVIDLGLRSQPNLERLASLAPDRILISPMFANLAPRLQRIAPVDLLTLYTPGRDNWQEMLELTRRLGELANRPEAAERLIADTEARLETLRQRLPATPSPLLVVQFMDARHVRVFGGNGLFQAVLERLGVENAWQGNTNAWGFSLVPLERLVSIDARLVVVEPFPIGVEEQLADSGLWQYQPSVRDGSWVALPPVWSFGALPSAQRFAELIVTALTGGAA
ncbi:iron-siderophore ABC transporter substrate-binding protein [Billgrantia saliphila]|uniref:iron-siderophore ABC transporter substrate-binding protein n=1 Tax=Billgrantia saliphila TaxID=1848458 RepID=UPI000CE39DE4|nr:iron-siderophore ABC transporter substrate-binding protein [Halomonas saliphila]